MPDEESDGLTFVGLDIESTGAGHQFQLVQIGLSLGKGDTFCSDIGWKGGSYILQAKALEVNGFDARRIERGPEPAEVDDLVVRWLARKGLGAKPKRLIPIGWNVGCLAPSHLILTSDLRWVSVGDLVPGDQIAGFTEPSPRRQWTKTTVLSNRESEDSMWAVELSDGRIVESTSEHPWLVPQHSNAQGYRWKRTKDLKPGSLVTQLLEPWKMDMSREAGWLAGFLDGEGSLDQSGFDKRHSAVSVSFTQNAGVEMESAIRLLEERGFRTSVYRRPRQSLSRSDCYTVTIRGGKYSSLKLLGSIRPGRLLGRFDMGRVGALKPGDVESNRPRPVRVKDVRSLGWRPVSKLCTSSGTYVADGFGMHNSFDMPFVRATLPRSAALFSRRSIDLNSICFLYGGPDGWQDYKEEAKKEAARIAGESRWHNAGFDAEAAILSFAYLRSRLAILDGPTAQLVESAGRIGTWRIGDALTEEQKKAMTAEESRE